MLGTMLRYISLLFSVFRNPFPISQSNNDHDNDHDHCDSNSQEQISQPAPPSPASTTPFQYHHDIKEKYPMHMNIISSSSSSSLDSPMVSINITNTSTHHSSSPSSLIRSSSSAPSLSSGNSIPAHEFSLKTNPSQAFHPIIETVREHELGRNILVLAVPMTVGLFSISNPVNGALAGHLIAVSLSVGFVGIWNGILLRGTFPKTSNVIELIGISLMLLAFFGIIACILKDNLISVPLICWLLSLIPFILAFCLRQRANRNIEDPSRSTKLSTPRPLV